MSANETILISAPISGITNAELTSLRISGWDDGSRSTTGTGTFHFDDVLVQGTVNGTRAVPDTGGRHVRIASVNVYDGISEPGDTNHDALRAILVRMDADVVAFQELYNTETAALDAMATDLGYPYWEIAPNTGISGAQRVGFLSRYPLTATNVDSPPGANEFTRAVFRAVVDVPEAEQPLVVWAVHKKARNDTLSQFRRAVETQRILEDIAAYHSAHSNHVEFVVLGDFNADFYTQEQAPAFTETWFNQIEQLLPTSYALGDDIVWPLPYARYPDDRYASAILPLGRVQMTQPGGFGTYSFLNANFISRLDYIYASESLMTRHPRGEIYYTLLDGPHSGLPKAGDPVAASASWVSSDHLPVFADLYMTPAEIEPSGFTIHSPVHAASPKWGMHSSDAKQTTTDFDATASATPSTSRSDANLFEMESLPLPTLQLRQTSDGLLLLRFLSQDGRLYTIEAADLNDTGAGWLPLPNATDILGTGDWIEHPLRDPPPGQNIYRLRARSDN